MGGSAGVGQDRGSVAAGIDGYGPRVVGRRVLLGVRCRGSAWNTTRDAGGYSRHFALGLRHDSRGRVGVWRGTPRRGLCSGLVQGGRSTPENIEDMPYHVPCPAVLGPSTMAHPVSYLYPFS